MEGLGYIGLSLQAAYRIEGYIEDYYFLLIKFHSYSTNNLKKNYIYYGYTTNVSIQFHHNIISTFREYLCSP